MRQVQNLGFQSFLLFEHQKLSFCCTGSLFHWYLKCFFLINEQKDIQVTWTSIQLQGNLCNSIFNQWIRINIHDITEKRTLLTIWILNVYNSDYKYISHGIFHEQINNVTNLCKCLLHCSLQWDRVKATPTSQSHTPTVQFWLNTRALKQHTMQTVLDSVGNVQ